MVNYGLIKDTDIGFNKRKCQWSSLSKGYMAGQGKFQYFSHARMWTQRTPQKLDIDCAVSSLYLNNLAS